MQLYDVHIVWLRDIYTVWKGISLLGDDMFQIKAGYQLVFRTDKKKELQVVFKCPKCGHEGSFRYYTPEYCEKCHKTLPNVAMLLTNANDKIFYYKHGCTSSPRTFSETIGTIINNLCAKQ